MAETRIPESILRQVRTVVQQAHRYSPEEIEAHNRRVQAAIHTLATNEATQEAWKVLVDDLIETILLRTVPPEQQMGDMCVFNEGKRQTVLQLLLAGNGRA